MFELASIDESALPPACCTTEIALDDVEEYLPAALVTRFLRKAHEFRTQDRVYCYDLACSAFVGAATTTPLARLCTECRQETCTACKEQAHCGRVCTADLNDAVLRLAKKQGWKQCPACRHLVELEHGCYHMTCRCKKQFCYLCAAAWKTCTCPQFRDVPDVAPR